MTHERGDHKQTWLSQSPLQVFLPGDRQTSVFPKESGDQICGFASACPVRESVEMKKLPHTVSFGLLLMLAACQQVPGPTALQPQMITPTQMENIYKVFGGSATQETNLKVRN
jgi:hypothetical protein